MSSGIGRKIDGLPSILQIGIKSAIDADVMLKSSNKKGGANGRQTENHPVI
jgi:hypothetical protein